ncbi:MAG TPA: hypothetical protein VGB42_12380 [Candidatus Thermoplasmatota archaeon]
MRFLPFVVAGLLTPLLAAPSAAFPHPLTVVVYATPEGAGVNETITVHVEVYSHASLVQPDEIVGLAAAGGGEASVPLDLRSAGVGKYTAALHILPDFNLGYRTVWIDVTVRLEGHEEVGHFAYAIGAPGHPSGLYIGATVANPEQLGYEPLPGDTIVFQAHTHRDGRPVDEGTPSGRVLIYPYKDRFDEEVYTWGATDERSILGVQEGPGVFSYPFTIPRGTEVSTRFEFHADLPGTVPQPSAVAHVIVHPLPAVLEILNGAPAGSAARVCTSYRGHPVQNASVAFGLVPNPYSTGVQTGMVRENRTTGSDGCAAVPLELPGNPSGVRVIANVEAFGLTTRLMASGAYYDEPFEVQGHRDPPPHDFDLELLSDAEEVAPGTVATFTLAATVDGAPLGNARIAVFAGRWGTGWPSCIEEPVTDGKGQFSFDCAIPADWTWQDRLRVHFVTEAGEMAIAHISLGRAPPNSEHWSFGAGGVPLQLEVTQQSANGTIQVRAFPPDGSAVVGQVAWAELLPADTVLPEPSDTVDGALPRGLLRWDGEAFSGSFRLPAWLREGEYVVAVWSTSEFGFRVRAAGPGFFNETEVHLTLPPPSPVDGSASEPPEVLGGGATFPEDSATAARPERMGDSFPFLWLLLFLVAACVGLGWVLRERSKRTQAEEGEDPRDATR